MSDAEAPSKAAAPSPALPVRVMPIEAAHLDDVGRFLHENLNRRFSAERWTQSITHPWSAQAPNHGMQLLEGERIVGVFCAIYSDQVINGRVEHFCNPHSWCVLESHRRHGIGLILQLVRQKGWHFTMFTPNPKVTEVFRGLKFKDLDSRQWVTLNIPSPAALLPGRFAESRPDHIARRLKGVALAEFEAHRRIPWLNFTAFGTDDDAALAIHKPTHWKRTRCAWLMHVSDRGTFERQGHLLRSHLLLSHGFVTSRIESRWLDARPPLSVAAVRTQPKLYQSGSLGDREIRDVYSELMSLDV